MFHPLADTENSVTYRLPDGAKTDIANAPTKENLERSTTPGKCDSDNKPMEADSFHHRS
jgi:hypothetical protein